MKHPYLISSHHPFSTLLVSHFHLATEHQGRHITLGALREEDFFLTHGSSFVKKYLHSCMTCRRLRGAPQLQKMSDLPVDRLEESPPFAYSGMDVFGPDLISESRSTRQYNSDRKVWGLVFTCLVIRAIHIEPLPSMDTSTFKNALRRFFAIRGICKLFRSDHGSNFVGARNQDLSEISFHDIKSEIDHN